MLIMVTCAQTFMIKFMISFYLFIYLVFVFKIFPNSSGYTNTNGVSKFRKSAEHSVLSQAPVPNDPERDKHHRKWMDR